MPCKKEEKIDWRIVAVGLCCLTAIEIACLFNGKDGIILNLIIGIICLAIGIQIPNFIKK